MKKSPFIYGSTVSDQSFVNRQSEIQKLKNNLLNGVNTTIISPRRWGKSSLVEKVFSDINQNNKEVKTVIIDLFTVGTEEEFLELFAREVLKASSTRWEDWMTSGRDIFKKLIPKLSIGVDPLSDFSISFNWNELKKNSEEILNLPESLAASKGHKMIVGLDEFQNLASFPDFENLEKKMRSYWQRHKSVTYCLFGSKRHMMTKIFNQSSKPFYRFGDTLLLNKIDKHHWVKFIQSGFQDTGKTIQTNICEKIPDLMKNHSWYVQQLAHYTWNSTETEATQVELNMALKELLDANAPFYQKEIETISNTQLNLLKAVARDEVQLTSTKVMQTYLLGTPNNVSKNKNILINSDLIQEVAGKYEFVDPAFELWFNMQFFNKKYF